MTSTVTTVLVEKAPTASCCIGTHTKQGSTNSVQLGMSPVGGPSRSLLYHLYTLWLFTRSDLKTIILPIGTFALGLALSPAEVTSRSLENTSLSALAIRVPLMILWIWNTLLLACISNQRFPEASLEDEINKPWRPMPSKRLSHSEAESWLKGSIISASLLGLALGNYTSTVTLVMLTWLLNELGGHTNIWQRNALNGVGYMICGYGALEVLTGADLLPRAVHWTLITGAIVLTTIHMQDLPDVEGDTARGRVTVPILWGDLNARISLAVWIPFWSAACPFFWNATVTGWAVSLGFGVVLGFMAMQRRGQDWDKLCWKLWCFWIAMLYMLPTFGI